MHLMAIATFDKQKEVIVMKTHRRVSLQIVAIFNKIG